MKDFWKWNEKKVTLNGLPQAPHFREREVWYCHLGANVGFEQDGVGGDFLRPVIFFRKFNNQIFWGVPLTRTEKKTLFYFSFELNGARSTAILSQNRLIDGRRLSHKIRCVRGEF